MILDVFGLFINVLGRAASFLFTLKITDQVSVGSFLVASAIMSVIIAVIFSGIRSMVVFNNNENAQSKASKSNPE